MDFLSGFLKQNNKGDYLSKLESYQQKPLKTTSTYSSAVVRMSAEANP